MENYYQTLGVNQKSTDKEIKVAFKRLAVKYHPDKNPDDHTAEEKFKQINTAYQTLSDPSLRAAYDLRLMNRDYEIQFHQRQAQPQGQSGMHQHGGRRYRRTRPQGGATFQERGQSKKEKAEEQKKGIFWAFGIVGAVMLVFFIMMGVNSFLSYLHAEEVKERRVELRKQIEANMSAEDFKNLLDDIDQDLSGTNGYDVELDRFRDEVMDAFRSMAQAKFNNKEYKAALSFFELWEHLEPHEEGFLNTRMAESYKNMGQFDLAEKYLYKMIAAEQSMVFAYAELARIQARYMNNLPQALAYYDTASAFIIKDYEEEFGAAYGIMLDPKRLPILQYEVYLEKGKVMVDLGQDRAAIIACNWASFIRMNHPEAYYVKGNAEYNLGNSKIACQDWAKASSLGSTLANGKLSQFCKN